MTRDYSTFIGIDLGGARGKTTAVAILALEPKTGRPSVQRVSARDPDHADAPWNDENLLSMIASQVEKADGASGVCIAIDAPLTAPACVRCIQPVCPGQNECVDQATVWLETVGSQQVEAAIEAADQIAIARPQSTVGRHEGPRPESFGTLFAYVHRCTEIDLHYRRGLFPKQSLGQGTSSVANRGQHLRKRLAALGFELNANLIEVSPRATVHALIGEHHARGYKRDADPWSTRAAILDGIGAGTRSADDSGSDVLRFAPASRFSREECLANDHCFEALLSAYTAYLYSRDNWQMPASPDTPWTDDGYIWAPDQ